MDLSIADAKRAGKPVDPMDMAIYNANLGNADKAFEWLEKCFNDRRVGLVSLKVTYSWDKIRNDSRFNDLVRRVGLP